MIGDIGIVSFGRGKPLNLMDGGGILVNNKELLNIMHDEFNKYNNTSIVIKNLSYIIKLIAFSIFYNPSLYWIPKKIPFLNIGKTKYEINYTISTINKYCLNAIDIIIPKYSDIKINRDFIAKKYLLKLTEINNNNIITPSIGYKYSSLLRFPIIYKDKIKRKEILIKLEKQGLGATGMYPIPLNEIKELRKYGGESSKYKNGKYISERIITLPINDHVKRKTIEKICAIISK